MIRRLKEYLKANQNALLLSSLSKEGLKERIEGLLKTTLSLVVEKNFQDFSFIPE